MTRWLARLCLLSTLFAFCVILLGAYTRLKDAGLGCPDWPGCYGQVFAPASKHEITKANDAYPTMPVDVGKAKTEMTHRYFAETLGSLIFLFAGLAFWQRRKLPLPNWLGPLLVILVLFQGLLGMWTVTLKLLPVVVMGHLLGGFCTLSLLWWAWLYFQKQPDPLRGIPKYLQACGIIALLVLIGQIALGGWTSANYAALICPDFPTCQGNWWPQMSHKLTAIHMGHRIGALITLLVGIVLCILLWRQPQVWLKRFSLILLGLLLLQVTLGISNIVFYLPLPIALAHHATAAILLLTLLALNFFLYPVNRNRHDLVS